jgi:exodeoxyribonuclease VII large subunit
LAFGGITLSVSQVNLYIKSLFERDKTITSVTIKGEISNFKSHTSGHFYMSLKDDGAVLRAVMFKTSAAKLSFKLENGMKVLASGRISVYERDGQYQLYVESMRLDGVGDLYVAFEKLKKKLNQEGLFDLSHKRVLPKYPKMIGIVTSPTGAAIRDILNVLKRRFSYSNVILYPVLVQGGNASSNIVEAIEYFNKEKTVDVLVIGRGGGSIEDLWAFNEENVARSIYKSKIPIVSAVGHEIDFTISDFVADVRAPTPSAAAEIIVPSHIELKKQLNTIYGHAIYCIKKFIEKRQDKLILMLKNIVSRNPINKINEKRIYLDNLVKIMLNFMTKFLEKIKKCMQVAQSKICAMNPLNVLSRGYSIVKNNEGVILKSIDQLKIDDEICLVLEGGSAVCYVHEILQENN